MHLFRSWDKGSLALAANGIQIYDKHVFEEINCSSTFSYLGLGMSTHVKVREKGHDCGTHAMHSDARKGLRMDALITACQLCNPKLMLNTLCTYCKFWLKFDFFLNIFY